MVWYCISLSITIPFIFSYTSPRVTLRHRGPSPNNAESVLFSLISFKNRSEQACPESNNPR
ncbi:hypothetical protein I4U23_000598 [Adineta vaga]|nr:hypothetical protein I4U23_000598 [Adineta vaga]